MADEQTQQYDEQIEEQPEELPEEQPEEQSGEVVQVVTVDDVAYISTDAASAAVDGAVGLDDEYQQQVLGEITSLGQRMESLETSQRSAAELASTVQLATDQYEVVQNALQVLCTTSIFEMALLATLVGVVCFRVLAQGWRS